jgi:hypothetical protein
MKKKLKTVVAILLIIVTVMIVLGASFFQNKERDLKIYIYTPAEINFVGNITVLINNGTVFHDYYDINSSTPSPVPAGRKLVQLSNNERYVWIKALETNNNSHQEEKYDVDEGRWFTIGIVNGQIVVTQHDQPLVENPE